ncbi:hypothetical protein M3Y96_01183900 [Aphelenchoides besseyi]|nr:hypothetical protein M3Y96_01183900 [Aphelenchoides besseyi]
MVVNNNKMGLYGAVSFVCGNIIGSGLFITPTSILRKTNSVGLSLIIWGLSAVISVLGAYCYVELGTSIRKSGADFAYLCYVGWFPAAFTFMSTGCLMTYPATLAVQAQTFSEYLFQGIGINLKDKSMENYGKILTRLLLFLNFFSVKTFVSRFQIAATASKVLSTLTIVVIGGYYLIYKGDTHNLQRPFHGAKWYPGTIVTSFFSGLFSYDGWDILNFGVEEVENPKRTMSLAIIIGMSFVALLYLATNLSFFVVLSVDEMLKHDAVAMSFAEHTMGNAKYVMALLVSILLIVGKQNLTALICSTYFRYLYAGAREGHLPSFISIVNKEHDSPRCALFYHVHPEHIRTPLILPLIFMLICAALVIVTIVQEIDTAAVGLGFLVAGFFFYIIFLWDKALPRYDGYRNACRQINDKAAAYNQIIFNGVVDFEDIKESAEAEIEIETKRRETVASLTKRIVPLSSESEFEIKKQRF